MKRIILIIGIIWLVTACMPEETSREEQPTDLEKPTEKLQTMPEEMPDDFQFSVQFGVHAKNEVNTYDGRVTKDLIDHGTATAELLFTAAERAQIYEHMREINVFAEKKFIPADADETMCVQEPPEDEEWKITANGQEVGFQISGQFCESTDDAKKFRQLRNEIWKIVETKEAYRQLPEVVGGYE